MATGKNDVVIKVGLVTKAFEKGVKNLGTGFKKVGRVASKAILPMTAGLAATGVGIGLAIREFQKFELGLAGVQKVADFSKKELKEFEEQISELSKKIPVGTKELFETAEAAAVLGIRGSKNLTKFAETMGRMAVATDLQGEDAAKAIARVIQLSGEAPDSIDRFGSAIVSLGNNFKASESEILHNATRIRQSTAAYDIASTEILAIATATKEAGIRAELAGTAIGRVFRKMDKALAEGGDSLRALQEIMGMTGDEIERVFRDSPAKAFEVFINGLKKTKRPTAESARLLGEMELRGEGIMAVLPSLAKNSHRLTEAVEISNRAYRENNALLKESNAFFQTGAMQQRVFQNIVSDFAQRVGREFAPNWNQLVKETGRWIELMNNPETLNSISNLATLIGKAALSSAQLAGNMVEWLAYMSGDSTDLKKMHELELRVRRINTLLGTDKVRGASGIGGKARNRLIAEREDLLKEIKTINQRIVETEKERADEEVKIEKEKKEKITNIKTGGRGPGSSEETTEIEEDKEAKRQEEAEEIRRKRELQEEQDRQDIEGFRTKVLGIEKIQKERDLRAIALLKKQKDKEGKITKENQELISRYNALETADYLRKGRDKVRATQDVFDDIMTLTKHESKEAFYISQALNSTRVLMDTASAIMKSHAQVPWPGNWMEVGALAISGAAQLAVIKRQKPPAMKDGGRVGRMAGTPATGDHQMAFLEPKELVTPKDDADDVVDMQARMKGYKNQDIDDEMEEESRNQHITLGLEDDISDFIFVKRRMNQSLGIGVT